MSVDRFGMYKEQYYFEIDRKDKLAADVTLPLALLTLLFGSITYFVGKLEIVKANKFIIIVLLMLALLLVLISLAFAVYYIYRVFFSYKYEYKPSSSELNDYYIKVKDYYKKYPDDNIDIEELYQDYLLNTYCKCNKINTKNNDTKSMFLYKARIAIVVALIACTLALVICNVERVKCVYDNVKLNYQNTKEVNKVE